MANSYLEFSEVIPNLTDAEITWLRQQLEIVYAFGGTEYEEDKVREQLDPSDAQWTGCRAFRDMKDFEPDFGDGAGFAYEFVLDDLDSRWGHHLWLYTEEFGCVDRVAHLVQKFLRMFRPTDCWSLTYATTCSKPRVGEFGGGAVFVSANRINWINSHQWAESQRARFARQRSRKREAKAAPSVEGGTDGPT
jgi:hypothetical protein